MNDFFKLAWRNIWRNKRRTLITIASIFFAMFFALIMRSMQDGSYDHWTESVVESFTGFIQVHQDGYWDEQTINNTFTHHDSIMSTIRDIENVQAVIPRLESFALASSGDQTKGILVVGVNPEKEEQLTNPENNLISGEYLGTGSNGVLVSSRLAGVFKLDLQDTLTLISQGYHGVSAAGLFPVTGIIKIPNPELDRRIVYMALNCAQEFYGAYNQLSAYAINLHDSDKLEKTTTAIRDRIGDNHYEVMDWKEMNPEMVQAIQSDQASGFIMLGLLYLIIGFGVFGTVLMMTNERKREFGVMVALGMQKIKLSLIVTLEMFLLGLVGIITGVIGSIPVVIYFKYHPIQLTGQAAEAIEEYGLEPIMPFNLEFSIYLAQTGVVILIFFLAIIYPVYSITRLNESRALRA